MKIPPLFGPLPGHPLIRAALLGVLFFTLVSCAHPVFSPRQTALVCPQCRTVAVPTRGHYGGYPAQRFGARATAKPAPAYRHECPGCQGVLATFIKEGRWEHRCSVCAESPYTCPLSHPRDIPPGS